MKKFLEIYKKYTRAGPNYRYYPTTLGFKDKIKHDDVINNLEKLNGSGLNLQLLFPFYVDPDSHSTTYQIQMEKTTQLTEYIEYIKKEILIYKDYFKNNSITHIHILGSGSLLLDPPEFNRFIHFIVQSIEVNINQINLSLDISARFLDREKLEVLKNLGFKRLCITTLNFDHKLQVSTCHYQSYQHVKTLIKQAKNLGFDEICIELFYGLPNESFDNLRETIDSLIALNCEHICLSQYFHRPYYFKLQSLFDKSIFPTDDENYLRFKMCLEKLLSSDYKHLGMNCFVNKGSDLYLANEKELLNYNHTGYSLNSINDVISFGASSMSKIDGLFYQNHIDIEKYYDYLDNQKVPVSKGCFLTPNELLRKNIIKSLITHSRLDINDFQRKKVSLLSYIKETYAYLHEMEKDGLIILTNRSIEVTELGKYFLKNICALFDLNMRELTAFEND